MNKKTIFLTLILGLIFLIVLILSIDDRINRQTEKQLFTHTDSIPANKVGLLLGTSKYVKSGRLNQYFEYRILATESLYKSGKIENIVISGDNSR
jgi:SanA protein